MFNHVSSCFINSFTSLCKLRWSRFGHCWSGKLWPPLVFRPPRCWESHDFKTLQAHGTYSQHIRAYMLQSSFKQANLPAHFQTVHFVGTPLWDVSRLGAPRWWMEEVNQWIWGPWSFETPGNFSHSFNKQIHHIEINFEWFVPQFGTNQPCQLPLLTLRKVIPVKDYWGEKLSIGSSWANSEWFFLIKNGWMDHQCRISWKFISDVYRFVHFNLTPNFKMFCVCWMSLGRIAQITYVGTKRLLMRVG